LTCKSANDLVAGTPLAGLALDLDRVRTQKALETLSDVLERFVPGVQGMNRILNARVPIISFAHSITGAKCDISGDLRSVNFLLGNNYAMDVDCKEFVCTSTLNSAVYLCFCGLRLFGVGGFYLVNVSWIADA
jgi:hypothetical protein